jgi:hypothetical protein
MRVKLMRAIAPEDSRLLSYAVTLTCESHIDLGYISFQLEEVVGEAQVAVVPVENTDFHAAVKEFLDCAYKEGALKGGPVEVFLPPVPI